MTPNQLYLLKDRRFLPLFIVQFCGCLNDSILKNALIILITFKLADQFGFPAYILVMLANVIFILPFVLFASLAGQLADKYERSTLVKIIKFAEIAIIALAAYSFYYTNLHLLFICIGLMGIHSTFFGPIKYSVLPDHLNKDELLSANGYIEAGTFLSILFGTMLGGLYNSAENVIIVLSMIVAVIGFVLSWFIPKSNNYNPNVKIGMNLIKENIAIVKHAAAKTQVYLAILGISWFWFIGTAIMTQIPSLTKDILGANENVANLFLAVFSIGVGLGSFLCNKIFDNQITTKYVFLAAIGISICALDLCLASRIASESVHSDHITTVFEFLRKANDWRILADLFFLATIGGIYVVPLFAVMQYFSSQAYRSRVIAANNLMNSFFMAGSTVILSLLFYMDFSIPSVIFIVGILNLVVAYHIYNLAPNTKVMPYKLLQGFFKLFFFMLYDIKVVGLSNYKKAGKKTIIVANHLSYIEPALIATYMPGKITFAINMQIAKELWVKPFLKIVRTFPIESNSPMALKSIISYVKQGRKLAIFPEGRTSTTSSLMKIYEGPALIADKAAATILPIRIEGTEFTIFSKLKKNMNNSFSFRKKIIITILPPVKITPPDHFNSKERRKYLSQTLSGIMVNMTFESSAYNQTLFKSLIDSAKKYGYSKKIIIDHNDEKNTYQALLMQSFIMANLINRSAREAEHVGLMMPNTVKTIAVFFGIQASGRVPAMINFTAGESTIIACCKMSSIRTIYTSKEFIKTSSLEGLTHALEESQIRVIYLEDFKSKIDLLLRLKSFLATLIPEFYYRTICADQDSKAPSVILFTSGTEGHPKAVLLSHSNLLANKYQVEATFDLQPSDYAFNALPLFHSFGLTTTLIMTLRGIKTYFYPSPLHYKVIPEVIYDIGATIMFCTDTFLRGYAQSAHSYDFHSLRRVVSGAERLKASTKELMLEKFGIRVLEGYGATECSPVISCNTAIFYKSGTVGKIMPGLEYYIEKVDGVEIGGRLYIKGPNIMLGYIKQNQPKMIESPFVEKLGHGWYNTGDIVSIDDEGYITLIDREKRFAKIQGAAIPLSLIEDLAFEIDSDAFHAAIIIGNDRKGEEIILYTTSNKINKSGLIKLVHEKKLSELCIANEIIIVKEIPTQVNGKVDYKKITNDFKI